MRRLGLPVLAAMILAAGCAARPETTSRGTLADLRHAAPDMQEAEVEQGLKQAMEGYRRFLEEAPETEMTPEAMRRLADLQIEREFGLRGGDGKPREMAAPETARNPGRPAAAAPGATEWRTDAGAGSGPAADSALWESDADFEIRTTRASLLPGGDFTTGLPVDPGQDEAGPQGPLEAIALYDRLLTQYPNYEHNDQVLYQMARAYDELGRTEEAMATMDRLMQANPHSVHADEVQFRRGEHFFTRRKFREAESAYQAIIDMGTPSSYYELALYKMGWTLYKQEFYEEALHRYMALLDYKVATGYDFDQTGSEEDERRVADTYRVISLSFSNLGGPEAVQEYYAEFGNRSYEDRVYGNLGEHYLAKLRYDDAAKTYRAFVALYPIHRDAPAFSMHVVETFTQGGFPRLVLEAKRDFAARYGLKSDYWRHFEPEDRPEVVADLKANLKDVATHYHALYQETEEADDKLAPYREALRWYGDYLESFPEDVESPPINYRLADLLLEHEDFGAAALQYEHTAYGYPSHDQSAAAGYAAVYAHRRHLESAEDATRDAVKQETVASSLRFADTFPDHEQAAAVLGAAADDMYEMKSYPEAVASAQRVLDSYPGAEPDIRRSAWVVVAHGSFELADYGRAEGAYGQVLTATPEDDEGRADLVDNLAASIYKQGELAREAEDYRTAATHFLRIRSAAPGSTIRSTAEYDAGAALLAVEDWQRAAEVLEEFRSAYPEHELQLEATRSIAWAYRQDGQLSRAADEYDRIADQAEDPALRSEALLVAGDLYEQSQAPERALEVYGRYVHEFPEPIEIALETRFKMAEIHQAARDQDLYHQELQAIVRIEAEAGSGRTGRTRTIAARSAQVLAERLYRDFVDIRLSQPFEISLQEKQKGMDDVIQAMEHLVAYEIAETTSAATYYMAEAYLDFSRALIESERPTDLDPAEMAEYELVLEDEAFPFEERGIALHEENMELLHAGGVFNPWIEKTLDRLSRLMPARYARSEMSNGFLGTIGTYVYQAPAPEVYGPQLSRSEPAGTDPAVQATHLAPVGLQD